MKIQLSQFKGLIPKLEPTLLPESNAADAVNTKLWTGGLDSFRAGTTAFTPTKSGTIKTIYRFGATSGDDDSGYPFHWTTVVDVIRGPVAGDVTERTYFTGDGVPKVTDNVLALTGGTDYPENAYTLGIPAPDITIGVAVSGDADEDATEADAINRAYVVTYMSAWGEEGPPSAPSEIVTLLPGQSVDLSALGAAPTGNYNITVKRIYRSISGANTDQFFHVADIPVATGTYSDTIDDSVVGFELETSGWFAPPTDMHSLGLLDNGIGFGASKNQLYVSERNLLHAWNPLNAIPANHDIVGTGSFAGTIVALTTKNPMLVTGVDPAAMSSQELNINQGCISKRSIVSGPFGVLYASKDGLVLIGPGAYGPVVTENFLTRDQWLALNPHSLMGVLYNGMYMGFYDNGTDQRAFILDPDNPDSGFLYLDIYATAAYADPLSDQLLLMVENNIELFDSGDPLGHLWRSKIYQFERPANFTCARIYAADYDDLTFKAYVDGTLKHTQTVTNKKPFRLPYSPGERFEFSLEGTSKVTSVEIAESADELLQ